MPIIIITNFPICREAWSYLEKNNKRNFIFINYISTLSLELLSLYLNKPSPLPSAPYHQLLNLNIDWIRIQTTFSKLTCQLNMIMPIFINIYLNIYHKWSNLSLHSLSNLIRNIFLWKGSKWSKHRSLLTKMHWTSSLIQTILRMHNKHKNIILEIEINNQLLILINLK